MLSIWIKFYHRFNEKIMGTRPFNTIFSFNYHNIRPIVNFLISSRDEYITSVDNKLLDVGGGASPYHQIYKNVVSDYIVVDFESSLPQHEQRNIIHKVGNAEDLPIETESIDIVLSNQVLEHVLDERKAVEESFRVLKIGGLFIGSVPHVSPIHLEPYDYRRFTYHGIKKILEDQGFKVLKIEGNGGVHKAMSVSLMMDWYLSKLKEGESQVFHGQRHFLFFMINGMINVMGSLGDKILGNKKRTPSNYCWIAMKSRVI